MDELQKKGYKFYNEPYSIDVLVNKSDYNNEKNLSILEKIYPLINPKYNEVHSKTSKTDGDFNIIKETINKIENNRKKSEAYLEKENFKSVGGALKLFSLVITIAMGLLVFNSINLLVIERIKQYGALRCIGMSKRQLNKLLFWEIIIYSFFGITSGLILGIILNKFIGEGIIFLLVNKNISLIKDSISFLQVALLAFAAIVIASSKVVFKMRNMVPVEALNYCETNSFKIKNIKNIKFENKNQLIRLFANRNIKRNKSKSITVFLSLSVCITLLSIIVNMLLSVERPKKNIKTTFSDYEIIQDFTGKDKEYLKENNINEMKELPGVKEVYALSCIVEQGLRDNNNNFLPSIVIYNDKLFEVLIKENPELQGIDFKNKDIAIFMNNIDIENDEKNKNKLTSLVYKENDMVEGNISNIYEKENQSKKIKFNITKTINGKGILYGGNTKLDNQYFIINEKVARAIYGELFYTDIMIDLNGEINGEFQTRIAEIIKDKEGITFGAYDVGLKESQRQMLAIICIALYMVVSTAMVGFLNMRNTIKANIITRNKENGMLRSIGMSKNMLSKVIYYENTKLSFYASIFSCIIAIPVCMYLTETMLDRIEVKIYVFVLVSIIAVLVSFLIARNEVKKAFKNTIIASITQE